MMLSKCCAKGDPLANVVSLMLSLSSVEANLEVVSARSLSLKLMFNLSRSRSLNSMLIVSIDLLTLSLRCLEVKMF